MPVYLYWGEDDFAMQEEISKLKQAVVDPHWFQFNYDKLSGQDEATLREGLNQAMTPVFGMGDRLIWLVETNICQSCSEDLLLELKRTLPQIPSCSHLLLTCSKKPDSRLKSTKLLQKYATVKDFALIPPWQTEAILKKVQETAQQRRVKLTYKATEMLAKSVGNDSRLLANELEKLSLYQEDKNVPIDVDIIKTLVNVSPQNSLALATAILKKDISQALQLINELINLNEPPLRIIATLVAQFRTWTIVKLMLEKGDKNEQEIAVAAEMGNPKRIYFLKKEIKGVSGEQLLGTFPLLLQIELGLKKGADPLMIFETKIIEIIKLLVLKN
jgi:DNA polymerase-3 subunit delta